MQYFNQNLNLYDKPYYEDILVEENVNEEAIKYNRDGYIVLNIKDYDWLEILDEASEKLKKLEQNKKDQNIRFQDIWKNNEYYFVKKIATYRRILNFLDNLYGRKALPFQTLNFLKGSEQHFHSDSVHFSCMPQGFMCGVWVAIEDIDPESGPLYFFPGSHKLPYISSKHLKIKLDDILNSNHPQLFFENYWKEMIQKFNFKKELFIPKKGDLIIWHANLLHGGEKVNDKSKTRLSQVTHYYFEKCTYFTPFFECHNKVDYNNYWRNPEFIV